MLLAAVWLASVCAWAEDGRSELEPIKPIPVELDPPLDADRVELGRQLFLDPRLSGDNSVSCFSCHDLDKAGGADTRQFSTGAGGAVGGRNAPTIFNVGLNYRQLWDARADSLETQVRKVMEAKKVMNIKWPDLVRKLDSDSAYKALFERAYPEQGLSSESVIDAIATFERSLITPNSRFDRYLRGDDSAITAEELRGYELFKEYGCASCHQGANVGGNMTQVFGVLDEVPGRDESAKDTGRFKITGKEEDKFVFRVPSLRLAAVTPPYFHDGSVATLEEAVDIMIKVQLRREVPTGDRDDIIRFLGTLVGTYKGKQL